MNTEDILNDKKSLFWTPAFLDVSAWIEHIPFAFWLMEVHRPKVFVELGVHNGVSYFSFCQAVKQMNIETLCYAVDSWQGDEHSGFYPEEIYNKVNAYNTKEYSRFSTLIRSTFDEASQYFLDGSVDLLHIDGFHSYEAVKHDFETWLPKLSTNSIVLFHDINVRERHFGVFKYWEELSQQYDAFQFDFGHGLGVISVNNNFNSCLNLLSRGKNNSTFLFLNNLFSERGSFFKQRFFFEAATHNFNSEINEGNKLLTEKTETLNRMEELCRLSTSSFDSLKIEYASIKKDYDQLKHQLKTVSDDNATVNTINEDLKTKIILVQENISQGNERNKALTLISENLQESSFILTNSLKELTKLYEDALAANGQLNESINLMMLENTTLKEKVIILTNDNSNNENRISQLDFYMNVSKVKINENDMALADLQNENLELLSKLGAAQETNSLLKESLEVLQQNVLQSTLQKERDVEIINDLSSRLRLSNHLLEESESAFKEMSFNKEVQSAQWLKQRQLVDWYKATYEDRSLAGIIKEKTLRLIKKKVKIFSKNSQSQHDAKTSNFQNNLQPTPNLQNLKTSKQKFVYNLRNANELIRLENEDTYESTGTDPYFFLDLKDTYVTEGWYWFSATIKEVKGAILGPKIYFDNGEGCNEQNTWNLPHPINGRIACLIHCPFKAYAIRVDPTTTKCSFTISQLFLKPVGKLKVFRVGLERHKKIHFANKSNSQYYKELTSLLIKNGTYDFKERLKQSVYFAETDTTARYKIWCKLYDFISPDILKNIRRTAADFPYSPLLSIIIPVYNPPIEFLKKAIESVRQQAYTNWEICISDDSSTKKNVKRVLQEYKEQDDRIKVIFRKTNGHISEASNSALELATGEYIVLLDQDDELPLHSLYMVAEALNNNKDLTILYSDEDKIDEYGNRFDPYFKTDWNKELFYGQNMVSHLGVYKRTLVKKVGGFRKGYEGSQDYDLALRCLEVVQPEQIYHIPHILYHWRAIKGSTAVKVSNKNYALDAGLRALQDHFKRLGENAIAEVNANNSYRIRWQLPDNKPLVSIIIPTKDKVGILSDCIQSIFNNTLYPNFEVLIIDNNSTDPETLVYYKKWKKQHDNLTVLDFKAPFNFSAMNNFGAANAKGTILLLLNNDTVVINNDWLCEMVSHCLKETTGAVGAKLYYPNGQIQHAGVFLHKGNPGNHIYLKREKDDPGYFNKLNLVQNYSAVTAACLAVRKKVYLEAGGLDEHNLKVAYNDVDFCLKLVKLGYKNVWTPFARLFHYESLSRGNDLDESNHSRFEKEHTFVLQKWNDIITQDPFYNPNLGFETTTTQYAFPPYVKYSWDM